ncbi:MAG: hypothetical protein ACYTF7_05695 [Planctomycetota bacterium]|jgi:hypothetical protein
MSMGISLLVLAGVSMTVPRGSWYGDGVARMSELHPATEYVHDLFRPDYEINIHHLIRPPRLPWHLTYLSDEYGAIQGWIIPGTHEAVVVEYNDSYLFDDTDRSRPGLYRYLIRFEHSRSGFMFTHFLNRTVVKQGIYTQYIDTNKPHQRNTYSIEKDVDPQEAQEYHELLLLRVQEQGRQGITGIDVDHVLRQKLKAGIYDDPVIVNSVVWMG